MSFFYYIRIFQNGKENKQLLESIDRDKGHSIITFALRVKGVVVVGSTKTRTHANRRGGEGEGSCQCKRLHITFLNLVFSP